MTLLYILLMPLEIALCVAADLLGGVADLIAWGYGLERS